MIVCAVRLKLLHLYQYLTGKNNNITKHFVLLPHKMSKFASKSKDFCCYKLPQ